ncbi:hypothetical protein LJC49_09170 [Ruminococcaceae bacterium OttesenSCG-928-I18]|nr:hypothetical protein [Ruminococcaceae bacterium OttesenSCG-928-I18]
MSEARFLQLGYGVLDPTVGMKKGVLFASIDIACIKQNKLRFDNILCFVRLL